MDDKTPAAPPRPTALNVQAQHVRPVEHAILIKPEKLSQARSKGGILIPHNAQERSVKVGRVIAQGPGRFNPTINGCLPMPCAVGDLVLVSDIGTVNATLDGEVYWVTEGNQIIAVIGQADEVDDDGKAAASHASQTAHGSVAGLVVPNGAGYRNRA